MKCWQGSPCSSTRRDKTPLVYCIIGEYMNWIIGGIICWCMVSCTNEIITILADIRDCLQTLRDRK